MDHLTNLFKLLELTRAMPQYGYALSGIKQDDLSNLAEHQYLTAMIGWQLATAIHRAGANINVEHVVMMCLVHDLPELFGGDISFHYARNNPKAKRLAKAFEAENMNFFSKFFGPEQKTFRKLLEEEQAVKKTDDAIVAKVADYVECAQYKQFVGKLHTQDSTIMVDTLTALVSQMKDAVAKRELKKFLKVWGRALPKGEAIDVLYQ